MIRTYICPIYGITPAEQEDICRPKGMSVDALYIDGKMSFPKHRTALIGSCRVNGKGDTVLVSDLAVLAANKKDLREVRAALKAKGASILEGRTGRRSTNAEQYADMVQDAFDRWASKGKRWSNEKSQAEDASKGGKALAKQRADRKVPKRQALTIWRDEKLSTEEAIHKINVIPGYDLDWSHTSLYRHLGPRKLPTGPISARK